jgi:hypothetical protein
MPVEQLPETQGAPAASEALSLARERRADLHSGIVALEAASAAPARGREPAWLAGVHDALVEVGAAFERHIAEVEGPAELFEEVGEAAPHLSNAVAGLRADHLTIRHRIVDALDAVRPRAGAPAPTTEAVREAVLGVLDRLMRHRQSGADVVYDAYAVDIGGSD